MPRPRTTYTLDEIRELLRHLASEEQECAARWPRYAARSEAAADALFHYANSESLGLLLNDALMNLHVPTTRVVADPDPELQGAC